MFPRLDGLSTDLAGSGLTVEVRFVKKNGLPITFVNGEAALDASAIRTVDLQKKYHRSAFGLADSLKLSRPRATALRVHLGLDQNPSMRHVFSFGSQKHARFSDNAFTVMRDALEVVDMDALWRSHGTGRNRLTKPTCAQPGCAGRSGLGS